MGFPFRTPAYLCALLLVVLPWWFLPFTRDPFLLPKEGVLVVGCFLILICALFGHTQPSSPWRNPWAKWFLLWLMLSSGIRFWWTMAKTPTIHIVDLPRSTVILDWSMWSTLLNVFLGCVFVWSLTCIILRDRQTIAFLTSATCVACATVACCALLQRVGVDQFFLDQRTVNTYLGSNVQHQGGLLTVPPVPLGGYTEKEWDLDIPKRVWEAESRRRKASWKEFLDLNRYRMVATLGNVNYVSTYLALHLPLFLAFKQKRYLVGFLLTLGVLLWSASRFAIIAGGAGLLLWGWLRLRLHMTKRIRLIMALSLLGLLLVGVWYFRGELPRDERWEIWSLTMVKWAQIPWTGHGLGGFAESFQADWDMIRQYLARMGHHTPWKWAHNDLLQLGYETGLIGLFLCLGMLVNVFRRASRRSEDVLKAAWLSSMASLLLLSLVNFPWHLAPVAFVGLLGWGMLEHDATS